MVAAGFAPILAIDAGGYECRLRVSVAGDALIALAHARPVLRDDANELHLRVLAKVALDVFDQRADRLGVARADAKLAQVGTTLAVV